MREQRNDPKRLKDIYHAVIYNIMIIGEAANMLTFEFRENHAEMQWRQITNMRNFLIPILRATNVLRVDAQFRFHLITADKDDNKFVDCAIVANAEYIVTNDKHFNEWASIPFPHVEVRTLEEFQSELNKSNN